MGKKRTDNCLGNITKMEKLLNGDTSYLYVMMETVCKSNQIHQCSCDVNSQTTQTHDGRETQVNNIIVLMTGRQKSITQTRDNMKTQINNTNT